MNPYYIASKTGEPKIINRTMVGDAQSVIYRVPNLRMPIYKWTGRNQVLNFLLFNQLKSVVKIKSTEVIEPEDLV